MSYSQASISYFGLPLNIMWRSTISSMSFFGFVVQFLAPILLIVIVAVVFISKPEEMTLRR